MAQQPVAFFDIDGTLFRSSLLIELVETLVEEGVFPAKVADVYRSQFLAWQDRKGTYEAYIEAVIDAYLAHIQGVHYGEFADVGKMVVAEHRQHVYRFTRDYIQELRGQGYFIVAISQSPKTILDEFCADHGIDKVYGRMYEIGPQDKFTGEIVDVHLIENKANIVKRVLADERFTSAGSVAVGDTEGDITLLESVEKPLCFNPNQKLYDHAKRCNWPVVVERKDVIYKL